MKAHTFTLACLLFLTAPALHAQTSSPSGPAASRTELHTYFQQRVLPVVRQQRQKLEAQLTTSDKAQLVLYRAQLQETHQKSQALRQALRPATPGSRPELTEAQRQQVQQLREETKAIRQQVSQLAQKYEADIARLAQQVQPQREQWATDTKVLRDQMAAAQPGASTRKAGRHPRLEGARRYFQPATFLLLDPNAPVPGPAVGAGVQVYPNPSTTTTQLEYEVKKAGPVTVELLDGRGNTLRTVAQDARQDKGRHTLAVSVADLPLGTYYYKITTRTGAETKRFLKE